MHVPLHQHAARRHGASAEDAPWKSVGTVVWFATTSTWNVLCVPSAAVAFSVTTAGAVPAGALFQSMATSTRCSCASGEIFPPLGVVFTHETFALAVNVNVTGPPEPTSMNLLLCGRYRSR